MINLFIQKRSDTHLHGELASCRFFTICSDNVFGQRCGKQTQTLRSMGN